MYVCDWYNPVKGHAQYSLRDERRDRHSGRIWRITAKGKSVQSMPAIFGSPLNELLDLLKRPEFRIRYLAKQELRKRDSDQVVRVLDQWVSNLDPEDPRFRHRLGGIGGRRGSDDPGPDGHGDADVHGARPPRPAVAS